MTLWICATCAVEYPDTATPPQHCAICEDERQYVPRTGQAWTTNVELAASGHRLVITEREPDLFTITTDPRVGIGQHAVLVRTEAGNLLWDPTGFVDDDGVDRVRELGGATYIVASHPHMFGTQLAWSDALGGARVLVAEKDGEWLQRTGGAVEFWDGELELLPGVSIRGIGGHFPGSAVAYWSGADGKGVALVGDTLFPGPSGASVSFLRSYPNLIPLSAAVVDRVATAVAERQFDRAYGNFGNTLDADARAIVRRSADRYIAWVRGDHDHLT
jgi:Zn-dependent hydrolases, including glyoxylases